MVNTYLSTCVGEDENGAFLKYFVNVLVTFPLHSTSILKMKCYKEKNMFILNPLVTLMSPFKFKTNYWLLTLKTLI